VNVLHIREKCTLPFSVTSVIRSALSERNAHFLSRSRSLRDLSFDEFRNIFLRCYEAIANYRDGTLASAYTSKFFEPLDAGRYCSRDRIINWIKARVSVMRSMRNFSFSLIFFLSPAEPIAESWNLNYRNYAEGVVTLSFTIHCLSFTPTESGMTYHANIPSVTLEKEIADSLKLTSVPVNSFLKRL